MIKAIFFDLSGVLYTGSEVVTGAVAAISRARSRGLILRFVTNTSRRTSEQLLLDLQGLGFDIQIDELFSAPVAAKQWLLQKGYRPYCLVHRDITTEFSGFQPGDPDAVLIGDAAEDFNYQNLNRAFQLCQQGAVLVGIGCNRYFKLEGQLLLDAGPFIKAIEFAAQTEAVIIGKPAIEFFHQVLSSTGLAGEEVLMVGDDIYGDVEGAVLAGLQACLVHTGKYQPGDENKIEQPFYNVATIVEAVDLALTSLAE